MPDRCRGAVGVYALIRCVLFVCVCVLCVYIIVSSSRVCVLFGCV